MRFNQKKDGTDAGVSVVIGFIMILAIMMLGITMYQQNAVPQQERAAEVNHHRQTINQLQSFSSSFMQSADGRETSTDIKPGLTYGSSTSVFVNSPPSSGTLSVEDFQSNVLIENAEGVGKSSVFWDGEGSEQIVGNGGDNGVEYTTGYFSFSPQYFHYQNAPTTKLEYGMLYKDYRNVGISQQVRLNSQPVVSGEDINIVMMDGDLDTSQVSSTSIQVKPISASDESITVTNEGNNDRLRVHIPTNVPVSEWREMLASEACENNGAGLEASLSDGDINCDSGGGEGHVAEVFVDNSPSGDERIIQIVFEQGVTYDLKLSKLYITSEDSTTQTPDTKPLYAAWKGSEDITIREDSAISIDAVALDKYNNPISGSEVVAEAVNISGGDGGSYPDNCYGGYGSGDTYSDSTTCDNGESSGLYYQRGWEQSGDDGSVVFVYQAPEVGTDVRIEFRVCLQRYIDEGGAEQGPNQQQNLDNDDVIDQCAEVDENRNV